jgi:hypothetical protein
MEHKTNAEILIEGIAGEPPEMASEMIAALKASNMAPSDQKLVINALTLLDAAGMTVAAISENSVSAPIPEAACDILRGELTRIETLLSNAVEVVS